MNNKKFSIFTILDTITFTKGDVTSHPLFEKTYNIYMINRWLSMHPHTLMAAYFADQIQGLSKIQHFLLVKNLVDKKKIFIRYKKGKTKEKDSESIMRYFHVGIDEANEILQILTRKQINLIKKSFGGKK